MEQLFITDLDHTFLHSSQKVTPYSRRVWNRVAEDIPLSIATARSFNKSIEFFEGMTLNSPIILLDGAMLVTPKKELIEIKTLKKGVVDAIINESRRFGIEPFIIALDDYKTLSETFLLPPIMNSYQSTLIKNSYSNDKRIKFCRKTEGVDDSLKVVYMGEEKILRPLSIAIKELLQDEVEVKLAPEKYMDCYFLTILHPLADKANALKRLSEYLDIPLKNITVFGDSLNDIEMFKIAGTSVAVSNALDEVKKEASIILPYSNDEDGVARYLNREILKDF
jgi:Cof subfamily protein (haloacid dehalogenase superfamily)